MSISFLITSSENRFFINLAGFPPTTVYGSTSFVTTEYAPITVPSPIVIPDKILAVLQSFNHFCENHNIFIFIS